MGHTPQRIPAAWQAPRRAAPTPLTNYFDSLPLNSAGWRGFYFPLKSHNIVCSMADRRYFAVEIIKKYICLCPYNLYRSLGEPTIPMPHSLNIPQGWLLVNGTIYKSVAHPYALSLTYGDHSSHLWPHFFLSYCFHLLFLTFQFLPNLNCSFVYQKITPVICKAVFQKASNS